MEASGQLHAPDALSMGNNFGNYWIGGCGDPRAGLDVLGEEKISFQCRDSNHGPSNP